MQEKLVFMLTGENEEIISLAKFAGNPSVTATPRQLPLHKGAGKAERVDVGIDPYGREVDGASGSIGKFYRQPLRRRNGDTSPYTGEAIKEGNGQSLRRRCRHLSLHRGGGLKGAGRCGHRSLRLRSHVCGRKKERSIPQSATLTAPFTQGSR